METTTDYATIIALGLLMIVLFLMAIDLFLAIGTDILRERKRRMELKKDIQDLYWDIKTRQDL